MYPSGGISVWVLLPLTRSWLLDSERIVAPLIGIDDDLLAPNLTGESIAVLGVEAMSSRGLSLECDGSI